MHRSFIVIALAVSLFAQSAAAQSPLRFQQTREGGSVDPLPAAEFSSLGDPLFNLLLKNQANVVKLSDIEKAIQPLEENRRLFVVDEQIVSARSMVGGGAAVRRAVIAFTGEHKEEKTLDGNVMLSVSFSSSTFPDVEDVEAWGWDNDRARYNYYKLDRAGSGALTWKFRGSSVAADLMSASDRRGTCMRCHVTGAPIMKELHLPWNNWHAGVSGTFKADYLVSSSSAEKKWPVAKALPLQRLSTADSLEQNLMLPSLRRFNQSRVNVALKRDDATGNRATTSEGRMTVVAGRRLLRSLFETVEINLISSGRTSGFHPLGTQGAGGTIPIPRSFFLNADLIFGNGTLALDGLGISSSQPKGELTQEENKALIAKFDVRLGNTLGDTHFAWFVPEAAFLDIHLVDLMLKEGIVSAQVVAAAMAVDLEKPVFSAKRKALMKFVPDRFEFTPISEGADPVSMPYDPAKDELAKAMIAAIDADNPPTDSAASEFRTLLKSRNAVSELQRLVEAYAERLKTKLDTANPGRKDELERLFKVLIERRQEMIRDPVLKCLREFPLLLPLPAPVPPIPRPCIPP